MNSTPPPSDQQPPGWFGKLPALGDFASRRLPGAFIGRWDDWLQQNMSASRAALGQAWLERYLSWPVWRFALMPGVIGDCAWAGVLMPSVDRVGRYFPLTVCAGLPASAALGASIVGFDGWLARLERCALAALDPQQGLYRLEAALRDCPPCPLPPVAAGSANGIEASAPPRAGLAAGEAPAGCLDRLSAAWLPGLLHGRSLWWSSDAQAACDGFVAPGLPDDASFARMLGLGPA